MTFDAEQIKKHYPALERTVDGVPCVFADAPGGTQVPEVVIETMASYLRTSNANSGGSFATSDETDKMIDASRRAAADLIGCEASDVAFGPNMTTLNLGLSRAIARELGPGDEIVVTRLDHDANVSPWLLIAEDTGATLRWVDIDPETVTLDMESLDEALSERTKVVAFTMASNAVGSITDAREIVARSHAAGAVTVADAVHFAPHGPMDAREIGTDVLLCSPYKFYGPHMGLMYIAPEHHGRWRPYKVRPAHDSSPDMWETGTKNHEAMAGLIACVDHLASFGSGSSRRAALLETMKATVDHGVSLSGHFLDGAGTIDGLRVLGITEQDHLDRRTPTFAVTLESWSPRELSGWLGERGVYTWDGHYYAVEVMERLGLGENGAVRIGFCHYHSEKDVERVIELLGEAAHRA